jgi:hypothetical protein
MAADNRGRPGFVLDRGGAFTAETTSRAAFAPCPERSGAPLAAAAARQDVFLKHVKYGHSQVLPQDKTGFFASTTQLAYGASSWQVYVAHWEKVQRRRRGERLTFLPHALATMHAGDVQIDTRCVSATLLL